MQAYIYIATMQSSIVGLHRYDLAHYNVNKTDISRSCICKHYLDFGHPLRPVRRQWVNQNYHIFCLHVKINYPPLIPL